MHAFDKQLKLVTGLAMKAEANFQRLSSKLGS